MKKYISYIVLFIALLIPQIFIRTYWGVLISFLITGAAITMWGDIKKPVFTGFLFQIVIGIYLFMIVAGSSASYLSDIPEYYGISGFVMPLFAVLFNTMNVVACLYLGKSLISLLRSPQKA